MLLVYSHKWLHFKSIFLAIALCFISIPSYGERWYYLDKNETTACFVQHMAPNQDSPYLKAWLWIICRDQNKEQDGTRWDNAKLLYEVDCKNHRMRFLHAVAYDEEKPIESFPMHEDWKPATPDSRNDQFIKLVCDQSERSLFEPIEIDIKRELSILRDRRHQQAIKQSLTKSKWFLVCVANDKDDTLVNVFVDKNSLRIKGAYHQILSWTLGTNPSSEQPLSITKSIGSLQEFDCDKQRYRIFETLMFDKSGQPIILSGASSWELIRKNTVGYNEFFMVCQNKFEGTPVTVDFSTIQTIPVEWLVGLFDE